MFLRAFIEDARGDEDAGLVQLVTVVGMIVAVATRGLAEALRASPVPLSTMGRGFDDDPAYFLTAAAAGRYAAGLLR